MVNIAHNVKGDSPHFQNMCELIELFQMQDINSKFKHTCHIYQRKEVN